MADRVIDRKVLQAGETIFREGEEGSLAYVVQTGEIEIWKRTENNTEIVLGHIRPGGIFGEMALIDDSPRMASARATAMSTVIIVNRQMFEAKLAKCDPFIRGLLQIFARNIRSMAAKQAAET
jgi:CRP/FNR family transcriptional regulator, cyclic AMP receptor protein